MTEAWWPAFSPDMVAGHDGAGALAALAIFVALMTAGFMATIGRRVMLRSYGVAVLAGCAFVPLLMNAAAFAVSLHNPDGTDAGGMLAGIALVLSVCVLPVTLATSLLCVAILRRRSP